MGCLNIVLGAVALFITSSQDSELLEIIAMGIEYK
jgi:hypothetical protein